MDQAAFSPAEAVALNWAYTTIANITFAPLIAIHDALEAAEHDPRSLIGVRRELERSEPDNWLAIKWGRVLRLTGRALQSPRGNIAARIHAAFTRQGTASHLQAILAELEFKAVLDLMRIINAASRMKLLGDSRLAAMCAKASQVSDGDALVQFVRSSQPALAFLTADDWLGHDPGTVDPATIVRFIQGDPKAAEIARLMQGYVPSDWQWRFLFGRLVAAESEHDAHTCGRARDMGFYP